MVVWIFLEIVICFLALLGIYSAVHWLARRLFGSRHTLLAIEILTQRDADAAEELIRDALFSALGLPSGRVVVITTRELLQNERLRTVLTRFGVSCCLVEKTE
ncbi:MAG: hypothetical protein J6Q82_05410 [Clostridia bacterium]|nr:hypothetical protein [Clostridia bacterium]